VAKKGSFTELFVIENKLKADEGENQTSRYASPDALEKLKGTLSLSAVVTPRFIVLNLFPDQKPEDALFTQVTYQKPHNQLRQFVPGDCPTADRVVLGPTNGQGSACRPISHS
jgi:hypothetical protein